ncbi:MAG: hemerythrin domain-containing protein [Armatimonadota bacterium]
MKRHIALEPFSRDHYSGLTLAKGLIEGQPSATERCRSEWDAELRDHFEQEEKLLNPLIPQEFSEQLTREHREIAHLIFLLPDLGTTLGQALNDHIRWEERVLFPWIENNCTSDQMSALLAHTTIIEESRWKSNPTRKEQVKRRSHEPD